MLVNQHQFCEPRAPLEPPSSLLQAGDEKKLADANLDRPITVSIEDVTQGSVKSGEEPITMYTMRVSCAVHDASWTLAPRRYSEFEALHKGMRGLDSFSAVLPAKHLLVPTRSALIQRAAGLQRYCNELLSTPTALARSDVADFFELDKGLWHRTRASSADEKAAAIARLQSACRTFVASGQRLSRTATKKAHAEAEVQAEQALAKQASLWSPKRATGSCEPDSGDEKHSKRARPSPPQRRHSPSPNARSPVLPPVNSSESAKMASPWAARVRCVDADAATPSSDVPLQRSGVSDVLGAIGL